jgi:hypothetical protein
MPTSSRALIGVGAAVLTVSLAACSSSSSGGSTTGAGSGSSTTPTPSASSSTTDYTSLLIGASDITSVPGVTEGTPAAPPQGSGATVAFTAAGGRTLGDTVLVLPDAAAAQTAASQSVTAAKQEINGAQVSSAPIGDGGTAIRGTSSAGAVAILVFSEGKAFVVLQFVSKASDPVPTSVIKQVATAQDSKIKANLSAG